MKSIRVLRSKTNLIPLLQFLRWYYSEWSVLECMRWAKSLPQDIDLISKYEFDNILNKLTNIVEVEVIGEWETESEFDSHKIEYKSKKVIEAEKWLISLVEEDQRKIKVLIDYARRTVMPWS